MALDIVKKVKKINNIKNIINTIIMNISNIIKKSNVFSHRRRLSSLIVQLRRVSLHNK